MVDRSSAQAVYKGLALGNTRAGTLLYAANFRAGTIDVFDSQFRLTHVPGTFTDETIPDDFSPFNITNIGGKLYVAYAQRDKTGVDDLPGAGNGIIDVYRTNGTLIRRLVTNSALNSPWGMVRAPSSFGPFSNDLLVGNFGDGRINAFDTRTGRFAGALRDTRGRAIVNDGLWGLAFGNGIGGGKPNVLYFTAGPNEEQNGIFGSITVADVPVYSPLGMLGESAAVVPEPGVFLMTGTATILLLARRRPRIKSLGAF